LPRSIAARFNGRVPEDLYSTIVDNSADAIALLDAEGRIRFVTAPIERLSGYTPGELVGTSAFDLIHPHDRACVRAALQNALDSPGLAIRAEYRARHKDGSWHRREVVGVNRLGDPSVAAVVVNYRDTTARNVAEQALLERERVYQSMFNEALIGIAQTDLDGRFVLVNSHLCTLLGYTFEELTATDFITISHPDDVAQDLEGKTHLIAGAIDRYAREKRYRRKDGTFVWTNLTVSLHRDVGRGPNYFVSIIEDITEQKRAQEELRQIHKMEALGRLAGGIAHDFNNLLTAIVGYAELALGQLKGDTSFRSDLEEIQSAGKSAAALTRQLLAFSRKQMLQPQILDLNAIVSRMKTLLGRLIGEHIQIMWRLTTPLDRISADPGQIEQVVLNLALNARDAMPRGGTLSIETANVELDHSYVVDHPGAHAGPHVLLAISDTGVGMDSVVQKHLFEPFYSTKELGQGTGLGLATVYGIVKQSGGSIFVYSERDRGTTFKIFLPRIEHSRDVSSALSHMPGALTGTETILLVEDQPEVRAVTRETLRRYGYTVVESASGGEAVDAVRDRGGLIDLLVTDLVMPGMSGRALAEQFARHQPAARVLYMSGYTDDSVAQQGILEGDVAFIPKPFTPTALLRKVREVLDGAHDAKRS
jgi:two-component system cell cycle sensor histidine kinase/response regulator CckA